MERRDINYRSGVSAQCVCASVCEWRRFDGWEISVSIVRARGEIFETTVFCVRRCWLSSFRRCARDDDGCCCCCCYFDCFAIKRGDFFGLRFRACRACVCVRELAAYFNAFLHGRRVRGRVRRSCVCPLATRRTATAIGEQTRSTLSTLAHRNAITSSSLSSPPSSSSLQTVFCLECA